MRVPRIAWLVISTVIIMAAASAAPTGAEPLPPEPADPVVEFIAENQGISIDAASAVVRTQDSILNQVESGDIEDVPGFGGVWIDKDQRVTIGATSSDAIEMMAEALTTVATQVQFRKVQFTYLDLEAAASRLSRKIANLDYGSRQGAGVSIDTPSNRVLLSLPGSAAQSSEHPLASEGAEDIVKIVWDSSSPEPEVCSTTGPYCDPLRGGVEINSTGGSCTAGFYAYSVFDLKPYMITAGHCPAGTWYSTKPAGSPTPGTYVIGPRHSSHIGIFGDFGLVAINNPLGWMPQPWVVVLASAHTTANHEYKIKSDQSSYVGLSVCKTGATTGTTCGNVTQVGWSGNYSTGEFVGNLARVDYCSAPGDSGGPVYRLNGAYGIHVASFSACDGLYSSIGAAQAQLNVSLHLAP